MTSHADWAARGFGPALLPIIPPGVDLTEHSQVPLSQRGKVPGLRSAGGAWYGFKGWHGAEATPADHARWDAMGAGVGLQCGRFIAVDIDVLDEILAMHLAVLAERMLGAAPVRFGRAPKCVLLYAAAEDETIAKRRFSFRLPGDDTPHAVEILGEGQFFVADGIHPGTGRAFEWTGARPRKDALTVVTGAGLDAYLTAAQEAVTEAGGVAAKRTTASVSTGRDDIDQESLRAPSVELLLEAAPHVPNDGGYDEWIAGLAAWKAAAAGLLDDGGEALARDWTERWTGEGAGGGPTIPFEHKWARVQPPFAIGWRWIERQARERGGWFGGVAAEFTGVEMPEEAAVEDESGLTIQERMFRRYVWVEAVERVGDTASRRLLSRVQFNVRMAEIGPPHDSRRCAWSVFTADDRCRRIEGMTYRPGRDAVVEEAGALAFNTWRPSALRPRAGSVALYEELARRLFPAAKEREGVLDWLAALLQRPGEKPAFVLVIGGHEGIGKDSLVAPVVRALGLHNVSNIPMSTIMGPNTHWIAQKQLVIITEMHSFARREVMERLKPIGACPPDTLEVNIKYTPQYDVPNIIAGLYFTNHVDALALSDSDRRHFVAWSPHPNPEALAPAEKQAFEAWFRKAYYPWLNSGGAEAVAHWLLQRDLTAHWERARAPMTEGKALMRREGRSEATATLEDALEAMDLPDLVSPADLAARVSLGRGEKAVTGYAVARVLRTMGAVQVTKESVAVPASATVTGAKRVRIWALRNETEYRAVPGAALARKYAEMWGATVQDIQGFFAPHLAGDFPTSGKG